MTGAVFDRHGLPSGRNWGRTAAVSGVGLGILLLAAGVVAVLTEGAPRAGRPLAHAPVMSPAAQAPAAPAPRRAALVWHAPAEVSPPGTPVQEEYDQALAQGLGGQPGMSTAAAISVPSPAIAGGWRALPPAYTPESWAQNFVSGLLDIDYAHQSRAGLGQWLQANEAPELLPGVPTVAADKMLYVSLLDPAIFGGQPTPVPSATQWAAYARDGMSQEVSSLLFQTDPSWSAMVAAGWQPADTRMTEGDLSGVLTTRHGAAVGVARFRLQLIVGSGRWRDGYGSVTVGGWAED
jgi:hypothetical protein